MNKEQAHALADSLANEQAHPYAASNFLPTMSASTPYGADAPRYSISIPLGSCDEPMLFRLLAKARAHDASLTIRDSRAIFE